MQIICINSHIQNYFLGIAQLISVKGTAVYPTFITTNIHTVVFIMLTSKSPGHTSIIDNTEGSPVDSEIFNPFVSTHMHFLLISHLANMLNHRPL